VKKPNDSGDYDGNSPKRAWFSADNLTEIKPVCSYGGW
jgi:hypothetical protein